MAEEITSLKKIPVRRSDTHKGDYGRVKIIGGSLGMAGAVYMAARGALLAGAGLVECFVPERIIDIISKRIVSCLAKPFSCEDGHFAQDAAEDILEKADVERAIALVIALPAEAATEVIATNAKRLNPKIKIIARSHVPADDKRLKTKGVSITVEPEFEAAVSVSKKILNYFGKTDLNVDKYLKKSRRRQRSKMKVDKK